MVCASGPWQCSHLLWLLGTQHWGSSSSPWCSLRICVGRNKFPHKIKRYNDYGTGVQYNCQMGKGKNKMKKKGKSQKEKLFAAKLHALGLTLSSIHVILFQHIIIIGIMSFTYQVLLPIFYFWKCFNCLYVYTNFPMSGENERECVLFSHKVWTWLFPKIYIRNFSRSSVHRNLKSHFRNPKRYS